MTQSLHDLQYCRASEDSTALGLLESFFYKFEKINVFLSLFEDVFYEKKLDCIFGYDIFPESSFSQGICF